MGKKKKPKITVNEAVVLYLEAQKSLVAPKTITRYRCSLKPLETSFKNVLIQSLTPAALVAWSNNLSEQPARYMTSRVRRPVAGGLSNASLRTAIDAARRLFNWLVDEEHLEISPARRLKLPKRKKTAPKAISTETVRRMLVAAKAHSARDYAILLFLWTTACRADEVLKLIYADVNFSEREAKVSGKGSQERLVFIQSELADALQAWEEVRPGVIPKSSDHIFVTERGTPLKYAGLREVLRRTAKRAQVSGRWNLHSWRHGAAMQMLRNGADLVTVSQLLGHSTIIVTRWYADWVNEELKQRSFQFNPLKGIEMPSAEVDRATHL